MQAIEMEFITGPELDQYRRSFEFEDAMELVRRRYDGSLTLHDGSFELATGLSVHHLGGHTPGMQVVKVATKRGAVVLASDATHYYENMETEKPFVTIYDREKSKTAWRLLKELADSPQHVVPGHDPLVMARYPALSPRHEGIAVRLDVMPSA
jgi:glyoxylase-like metal-dependent hydrolase (beta-lactamase superfamily II)